MFQNHNSIGQNNTEQRAAKQHLDRRFTQQNASTSTILLSSQKRFPHTRTSTGTPTQGTPTGLQHAPHPQNRHIHPALLSPPSSFPPSSFSQDTTSHALGKQTSTQPFQKNSMKSKLFGNKPTLSTQTPQHKGTPTGLQHAPHPQNRHIHPALLSPPSSFPRSSFFSKRHFPCS